MPSVKTQVYKDDTVEIKFDQLDSETSIIFEANVEDEGARPEKEKENKDKEKQEALNRIQKAIEDPINYKTDD